jgi:hypothetical protein
MSEGVPTPLHTIRLRGAWSATPSEDGVRYTRKFGWPTAVDPRERVWLVASGCRGLAVATLNGSNLTVEQGSPGSFAVDITDRLDRRNELGLTLSTAAALGDVSLELRSAGSPSG